MRTSDPGHPTTCAAVPPSVARASSEPGSVEVRPMDLPDWPIPFDPTTELDWSNPVASRRLLLEHLDQEHDGASRRMTEVERHLRRLRRLLPAPPARILDAGCGPGLYAVRLAQAGHHVVGIDIGPAVVDHANAAARSGGVSTRCRIVQADLRGPLPRSLARERFDVVLLVYYVLEGLSGTAQTAALRRLAGLIERGGRLVIELRTRPDHPPGRISSWSRVPRSMLCDESHLLLTDTTWDPRTGVHVLRETAVLEDALRVQQSTSVLTTLGGARRLAERAGLRVHAVYDGWSRYHATGLSESLLVVAVRD